MAELGERKYLGRFEVSSTSVRRNGRLLKERRVTIRIPIILSVCSPGRLVGRLGVEQGWAQQQNEGGIRYGREG